jgi:hypothetical protein
MLTDLQLAQDYGQRAPIHLVRGETVAGRGYRQ